MRPELARPLFILTLLLLSGHPALARKEPDTSKGRSKADSADYLVEEEAQGCPAWLEEYARFHRDTRGKPDATYLMFGPCSDTVKCTGTGDRIRTSMAMLRLAALYKKVLLLSWDHPAPLWSFLQPQAIDWRYDTQLQAQLQNLTSVFDTGLTLAHNPTLNGLVMEGLHAQEFSQAKVAKSQAVRDFNMFMAGAPESIDYVTRHYVTLGRCFFRFLFKPHKQLWERAGEALKSVYGPKPGPYVAWHWRTGGLVGEPILGRTVTTHVNGTSRLHQVLCATQCAGDMAASVQLPPLHARPMLLVTDHNIIRQWVARGELAGAVTLNTTVVHVRSQSATPADIMNSWVDIALLARADCLLMSYSGFSWVALFMGNTTCHMDLTVCVKSQRQRMEGLSVR